MSACLSAIAFTIVANAMGFHLMIRGAMPKAFPLTLLVYFAIGCVFAYLYLSKNVKLAKVAIGAAATATSYSLIASLAISTNLTPDLGLKILVWFCLALASSFLAYLPLQIFVKKKATI